MVSSQTTRGLRRLQPWEGIQPVGLRHASDEASLGEIDDGLTEPLRER